jgi:hypothetical protein
MCSSELNITCLTEIWLNEFFSDHNVFFLCNVLYFVYCGDRSVIKYYRGLVAVTEEVSGVNSRSDRGSFEECA